MTGTSAAFAAVLDLLDEDGLVVLGAGSPGGAVRSGTGTVEGRDVLVCACGNGGPLGAGDVEQVSRVLALAASAGRPLVTVHDATGARTADGLAGLGAYGRLLRAAARTSGVVPHVAVVLGAAGQEQALLAGLADVVVAVRGGTRGNPGRPAHLSAPDAAAAVDLVRDVLSFLPANNLATPPRLPGAPDGTEDAGDPGLDDVVPAHPTAAYDVREVVSRLADDGEFLELHAGRSPGVVTGLARLDGRGTGIVATVPATAGGSLDAAGADRAAALVRTCDAFGLPVLTLVDTPGFVPGGDSGNGAGAEEEPAAVRLLHAYAAASVPLLTVLTGQAHGPAYLVLGSRHVGADVVLAWPRARIAVRDPLAVVAEQHGEELRAAGTTGGAEERWLDLVEDHEAAAAPGSAAGDVDAVVAPGDTREHLRRALRLLQRKQSALPARKHGNLPP
ncbi:acyl-CoA carboxylase subunit beta [Kineococcus sp. NUM-3379]